MKIISCLLVYLFSITFWGYITAFLLKINLHKKSAISVIGLVLFWIGLIFNIIYTGVLGWNFTPASDLEALLDSITFIVQMISIVLIYVGFFKNK